MWSSFLSQLTRKFSSLNEPMLKSFNKLIVLSIYGIKSSFQKTLYDNDTFYLFTVFAIDSHSSNNNYALAQSQSDAKPANEPALTKFAAYKLRAY